MCKQLQKKINNKLNKQPTTINKTLKIAKELGHPINETTTQRYLYQMNYTPQYNQETWVYDPKAKQKRLSSTLEKLEKSKICNEEQCFLLTIINQKHTSHKSILKALKRKGLNIAHTTLVRFLSRYDIAKNNNEIYEVKGLTKKLTAIAKKYKNRTFFSLKQYLISKLQQRPTTTNAVIKLAKEKGHKMHLRSAQRYLHQIDYSPTNNQGKWIHEAGAKQKRLKHALQRLETSDICDDEQSVLLEVINKSHKIIETIQNSLSKKKVNISNNFIQDTLSKYGIERNENGVFVAESLTKELYSLAVKNKDRKPLSLIDYLTSTLNYQPTTPKQFINIAKRAGHNLNESTAKFYLYKISYTPTGGKGKWFHDPNAKSKRIANALKSLDISTVCTIEQCILLEIINTKHETHDSIINALPSRGIEIASLTLQSVVNKYGISKNKNGYYAVEGLTKDLKDIAKKHKNRSFFNKEQFIITYAKKRDGQCCIAEIVKALTAEGYNQYYALNKNTVAEKLLKNGFIYEGTGPKTQRPLFHRPDHCYTLIKQSYNEFSTHKKYHSNYALVLYYVAQQDLIVTNLVKLLDSKHGIIERETRKAVHALRLRKTKQGLRFPNAANKKNYISRKKFKNIIATQTPTSIADQISKWDNEGITIDEIHKRIRFPMSKKDIRKLINKKQKNAETNKMSSSNSDSTQNSLQDIIDDSINPIDYILFQKAAVTPEERLKRYNQNLLKNIRKKSQNDLQQLLQRKGQAELPKESFIYRPNKKQLSNPVFFQILEPNQYKISWIRTYQIQTSLQSVQANGQVIQLFAPIQQAYQVNTTIGHDGSMRISHGGGSGGSKPRGLLKAGPGANESRFTRISRTFRNLTKPTISGKLVKGPGYIESTANGNIIRGPGAIPPMPIAGRVAGGYIGVFMVLPQACKDMTVIASPKTDVVEKGTAFLDLGAMASSMWLFTKFIASKYPKTAAVIMVGTAGKHAWECTQPILRELEKGQRGMLVYYTDEKAYLASGVSCTDGRKPVFLNQKMHIPSFLKK